MLVREEYRLAILIGLLGGFTTFSTFGAETFNFLADRRYWLAALNLLMMNGLGLLAIWLGTRLGEQRYGV